MVKCRITNLKPHQIFIDKVGLGNKEDIITVPPKGAIEIEVATDKQFINLVKKFKGTLIFKKENYKGA